MVMVYLLLRLIIYLTVTIRLKNFAKRKSEVAFNELVPMYT